MEELPRAKQSTSTADEELAELDDEPGAKYNKGKRIGRAACGWCLDGNHVARPEDEPDVMSEDGATRLRRGRPKTLGCVADQVFLSGDRRGESKGMSCVCAEEGHQRGPHPLRTA